MIQVLICFVQFYGKPEKQKNITVEPLTKNFELFNWIRPILQYGILSCSSEQVCLQHCSLLSDLTRSEYKDLEINQFFFNMLWFRSFITSQTLGKRSIIFWRQYYSLILKTMGKRGGFNVNYWLKVVEKNCKQIFKHMIKI